MDFDFEADQRALAATVRDVLAAHCPPAFVHASWASPGDFGSAWAQLAELGLLGALVEQSRGGLGLGVVDVVLCSEEVGRAAMPAPVVETLAVAAPLLATLGDEERLSAVLTGRAPSTAVLDGSGLVPYVPGARTAIVGDAGSARLLDDPPAHGRSRPTVDQARPIVQVMAGVGEVLTTDRALLTDRIDVAVVLTAAQLLGLADAMIQMTVRYCGTRLQFGVPIGSFQAVKHHLANAKLALEKARPVVYAAAYALDATVSEARLQVPAAKAMASDAAVLAARVCLQCHGAIGYTIEYDLHLWMKRAWALAAAWGDARQHRRFLAGALLPNEIGGRHD